MSVKYKELGFRSEEEREKAVKYTMENAEVSLPGTRVVRIGMMTYRVSLHLLKGQYFLISLPRRKELLLPRVWLITMPGFRLCEIPIGREMVVCDKRVVSVAVDDSELVYVCDYHGSGFKVFREVLDRQLKPVPASLCVRFCPQCIKTGVRPVKVSEVVKGVKREWYTEKVVYECRAFMPYGSEEEEIKRRRSYRGLRMICLDDWWWKRYVRRHGLE